MCDEIRLGRTVVHQDVLQSINEKYFGGFRINPIDQVDAQSYSQMYFDVPNIGN